MGESNGEVVLKVIGLCKRYGDNEVLRNLTFEVLRGEIFGFLGPNGAGKTTTINMICGLLKIEDGDIVINKESIKGNMDKFKTLIGMCPQNIVIWKNLTLLEQLEFMGQMYNVPRELARKRGLELLNALELSEKRNKLAKTLSGGMQRRLNIILALIHDPPILILDEPEAGLDPQSRILVRDYIRALTKKKTVILTTHDMDEAERLSDRVAIIDRGKLLVIDTPDNLKQNIGNGEVLEVKIPSDYNSALKNVIQEINGFGYKAAMNERDNILRVVSSEIFNALNKTYEVLKRNSITVEDIKIRKKTLEDVFISFTGRGLRE